MNIRARSNSRRTAADHSGKIIAACCAKRRDFGEESHGRERCLTNQAGKTQPRAALKQRFSSMIDIQTPKDRIVTVFGGSASSAAMWCGAGARRLARSRGDAPSDLAFHLQPLGRVGQIHAVQANVRYPESLAAACATLRRGQSGRHPRPWASRLLNRFSRGRAAVAKAAAARAFPMSCICRHRRRRAIGVRLCADQAEASAMLAAIPSAKIVRLRWCSPEDDFFNRFAGMARVAPFLPLIGGGETKLQRLCRRRGGSRVAPAAREGKSGLFMNWAPVVYTMRKIMEFVLATIQRKRILAPMPLTSPKAWDRSPKSSTPCC